MRKLNRSIYRVKFGKSLQEMAEMHEVSLTRISWVIKNFPSWKPGQPLPLKPRKTQDHNLVISRCRRTLANIRNRCLNPNEPRYSTYGGRNILPNITLEELVYLWVRDKASSLRWPSIDRIDNEQSYSLENCRFIELEDNARKGGFSA